MTLLLGVSPARALQCAAVFHQRLVSEPDFFTRALCLRREIETGSVNGSLRLLDECFGLQGLESMSAMQALRSQLDNS